MLKRKLIRKPRTYLFLILAVTALMASGQSSTIDSSLFMQTEDSLQAKTAPIEMNKEAADFANAYIKLHGPMLGDIKERSETLFPVIDSVFDEAGIPDELKYLAVIESNLKPSVTSRAGAAGLWQFMPVAGKMYGLKMSKGNDERRHIYKSTVAAASLLKDLYKQFDNWLLVLAAYNSGPGNMRRAMKKANSTDFWVLQNYLPGETRKHVKKFISMHYYFEGGISEVCLSPNELALYESKTSLASADIKKEEPVANANPLPATPDSKPKQPVMDVKQ